MPRVIGRTLQGFILAGMIVFLWLASSTVFANQLDDTIWDFSGSFSWKVQEGSEIYASSHRVVGGIMVFKEASWEASWYEVPANKAFGPSLYSGKGDYVIKGSEVVLQYFFATALETPSRTAKFSKPGTTMSIRWSGEQGEVTEKGNLAFKRRVHNPADITGEWVGNVTGRIKGEARLVISLNVDTEEEIGPFPGLYSASGDMPEPAGGNSNLTVGANFIMGPQNQVLYGLLWAYREEDGLFFSPKPIKGIYNTKTGKLTIQGKLLKEECDDDGDFFRCKVIQTLPFKIVVIKTP